MTTILPLVVGAVAIALLTVLNDQQSVATRVDASEAAQVTSAYYVRDVQSSQYFTTNSVPSTPFPGGMDTTLAECGVPAAGSTLILALEWTSYASGSEVPSEVSYWQVPSTVARVNTFDIVRYACVGAASSTPTSTVTVATDVSTSEPPVLSCTGTCSTYTTTWEATTGISAISLAVTQADITANGNRYDLLGYQYNLVGVPRVWSGGSGGAPAPSVLLTGVSDDTSCTPEGLLCLPATATLTVTGAIDLDSPAADGVYLNTGAKVNDMAGPVGAYNCTSCGAVVDAPANAWNAPTPAYFSPALQPPSSIAVPTIVAGNPTCTGSLSTASSTVSCPAGTYTTALLFGANNVTLDLTAGSNFEADVGYTGSTYTGDVINFSPGAYEFSMSGGLFAQGSGATVECTTCSSTAGGVFFYVTGTSAVTLTGALNNFNLPSSASGTYANILLYDAESQTNPPAITIDASTNASNSDSFGGAIIAPYAPLSVLTGVGSLSFENLEVANLTVSGSGSVSVVP